MSKISVNFFEFALLATDLYRENITSILSFCFNQENFTVEELIRRLLQDPKSCVLDPIQTIREDAQVSYLDLKQAVDIFRETFGNLKNSSSKLLAIVDLLGQEREFIGDIIEKVKNAKNSSKMLLGIPDCLRSKVKELVRDVQDGIGSSLKCVYRELGREDEVPEGSEDADEDGVFEEVTQNGDETINLPISSSDWYYGNWYPIQV